MAFAPVVPLGGVAGLAFLDRTYDRQLAQFVESPTLRRDIEAFRARAGGIETVEDLMADRQVLRVVLGAFGLEEDIDKRAYLRKVIEEGTLDPRAFANRIADPAYRQLSRELGFGDLGGRLGLSDVRDRIVERYERRQFETAVGARDVDLRVALAFRREIAEVAGSEAAETSGWFRVLGSKPLRRVVELGFGLPSQFGLLDIDRQAEDLRAKARELYGGEGSPAVFRDSAAVDDILRRFLARAQAEAGLAGLGGGAAAPASTAAQILQAGGLGASAQANLFASNFL